MLCETYVFYLNAFTQRALVLCIMHVLTYVNVISSFSRGFSVTSRPALGYHHAGEGIFNPLLLAVHSAPILNIQAVPNSIAAQTSFSAPYRPRREIL